ncbi:phosphoglycerate dehydrogenase [Aciduricibacillus chroicocephali]|uniref:D-3-phosphoglycerate dehydrogenase n=1 Tax=Aciduricibacillus chroicocephali TaxID=3054939 RepID=A0ABY9L1C5_9BACI|nr:phosphoglycerate dehydrogenase [Bacillaceae bacterium 44XB]
MNYKILVTDSLNEDGLQPLLSDNKMEVEISTNLSDDELAEKIKDADALLVRSQTEVTRSLLEKAKNLKIIGRAGVGVDNIDLDAATENGILVVNAPGGNTNSAAEHTMAMLMSLARNIPQAYSSLQKREWERKKYMGIEIKGKTLGIIGFGKIGAEVAHRAKGQRMEIIAYDPFMTKEKADKLGIKCGSVDDILRNADFITVHTPLIKQTRHMLNKDAFAKMKDGVRILNCARGGIIEECALLEAIKSGKVAGAALDVFENEPPFDSPLLELPQVITTPHLGGSTVEAQENVATDISHDVIKFFNGDVVLHPVNLPAMDKETMHRLSPYFELAEKLGEWLSQLAAEGIREIRLTAFGKIAEGDLSPLTRHAAKGLLQNFIDEEVNDVNALFLAGQRDIAIQETKSTHSREKSNLLAVEVVSNDGVHSISGTVLEGIGPRIVKIDGYNADLAPEGHILFIRHHDKPGAIGRMGSLLGDHDINIATMQVDRRGQGGEAIMLLSVDKHPDDEALEKLRALPNIEKVYPIDFN